MKKGSVFSLIIAALIAASAFSSCDAKNESETDGSDDFSATVTAEETKSDETQVNDTTDAPEDLDVKIGNLTKEEFLNVCSFKNVTNVTVEYVSTLEDLDVKTVTKQYYADNKIRSTVSIGNGVTADVIYERVTEGYSLWKVYSYSNLFGWLSVTQDEKELGEYALPNFDEVIELAASIPYEECVSYTVGDYTYYSGEARTVLRFEDKRLESISVTFEDHPASDYSFRFYGYGETEVEVPEEYTEVLDISAFDYSEYDKHFKFDNLTMKYMIKTVYKGEEDTFAATILLDGEKWKQIDLGDGTEIYADGKNTYIDGSIIDFTEFARGNGSVDELRSAYIACKPYLELQGEALVAEYVKGSTYYHSESLTSSIVQRWDETFKNIKITERDGFLSDMSYTKEYVSDSGDVYTLEITAIFELWNDTSVTD